MIEDAEEKLSEALSNVLLKEEVEGLDEDLVAYIAGMLNSSVVESDGVDPDSSLDETIGEVMVPFLDSVQCPDHLVEEARKQVLHVLQTILGSQTSSTTTSAAGGSGARKLTQGMVSFSSDLGQQTAAEEEANRYLWGTDTGVKAMANTLIDAHQDKTSAKEKRKVRKAEAEKMRKMLSSQNDTNIDEDDGDNLIKMNFRTMDYSQGADRKMDVQVRNVTVSLPNGTVLLDQGEIKWAANRRYGLIGENGIGKSTLLKAIARGDVEEFPKHLRVLHVRQEVPSHLSQELTVKDAVLKADLERTMLLEKEKELLKKLDQAADDPSSGEHLSLADKRKKLEARSDMKEMAADLKALDEVYAHLQMMGADNAESRAVMILSGLQFSPERQASRVCDLSGGWKMRVALAAALFVEPEILMLDEPTNHLDISSVVWLETYLVNYPGTLIVVSHDRGFLNEVCSDIIEFKRRKLTYYRGNFDNYVKQRDENIRNAMRAYQAYQSKREHMMEFIEKFRANAKRATMVQSRIKAVEKMDAEAPEAVEVDPVWRFSIPNAVPLGPPIIAVNDVSFDYSAVQADGSKKPESEFLLQKVNFGITLTSKIAILGANGMGKTTLLNLIMGKIKPIMGTVSINPNLRIGHFTQHSGDNFDLTLSALENLLNMFEDAEDQEIRSFLGKFQIQGNDALKPMMLLSGGQKSRVAFAALAYKKPHVLVIDEGSNHLSMEAVDALVEAVQDFKGGILVVSHDQHFVSNCCSEMWVVADGQATKFRGDFEEYKQHTSKLTQKRIEESVKRLNAGAK